MIINEAFENGFHTVSISESGAKHKASNVPNQDCVAYLTDKHSFFLAVADGVGSCLYAEQGSLSICQICQNVFEKLIRGKLRADSTSITEEIATRWLSYLNGKSSKEYCTTLKAIFVIDGNAILVSIGDGLLMLATSEQIVVAPEDVSDFLNETTCLTHHTCFSDLWSCEVDVRNQQFAVFAATDGVANSIISGQENALIQELLNNTDNDSLREELVEFFNDVRLLNADDKTVGVVKHDHQDD